MNKVLSASGTLNFQYPVPLTFWCSRLPPPIEPPPGGTTVLSPDHFPPLFSALLCLHPPHRSPPLRQSRSPLAGLVQVSLLLSSVPYLFLPYKVTYIFLLVTYITLRTDFKLTESRIHDRGKHSHMESNFKMSSADYKNSEEQSIIVGMLRKVAFVEQEKLNFKG